MIDLNFNNIDFSLIDKIEDPIQKTFFEDVKRRMLSGENIDPMKLINSIGDIMGSDNPEKLNKLKDLNKNLSGIVKSFNNIKM